MEALIVVVSLLVVGLFCIVFFARHRTLTVRMGFKVLVVDDDPMSITLVRAIFEREDFEVLSAESAREALRLVESEKPDLLLLDLMLPEIDGLTMCESLRQRAATAALPIIMLTGNHQRHWSCAGRGRVAFSHGLAPGRCSRL